MHKLKKATTVAKGTENAEYCDYKNRLDMLAAYLRESSAALKESERAWQEVCNKQKAFADKFANRYPDRDRVREFARESAQCSQLLVKEFVLKTESSSAPHWAVDGIVQEYLKEIGDIANEYKPVADALKEVTMYTKKVDDLQSAKKADEAKVGRNMEKLEDCRKKYEAILDRVVDRMKEVYNKRHVALKATYVAYWSSQLRAFNLIDASLDPTREFVESSVDYISQLKIRSMTPEAIDEFRAADATVPEINTTNIGTAKTTGAMTSSAPTTPTAGSNEVTTPNQASSAPTTPIATAPEGAKGIPMSPVDADGTETDVANEPPTAAI